MQYVHLIYEFSPKESDASVMLLFNRPLRLSENSLKWRELRYCAYNNSLDFNGLSTQQNDTQLIYVAAPRTAVWAV